MPDRPSLLHWYPRDPEKALARTNHLSPEVYTAFSRLRDHAWMASLRGEPACTLTTEDAELAALANIGKAWAKVGDKVRALFTLDGGRLLDTELYEIWKKQQAGYTKRVGASKKGVEAKKQRRTNGATNGDTNGSTKADAFDDQQEKELELEGEKNATPTGSSVLRSPASDDALAPGAPRDAAAEPADDLEQRRLERDYAAWRRAAFDEWTALHADEYATIRSSVLTAFGVPFTARAKPFDEHLQYVRDGLLDAVAAAARWPDAPTWIAQRRAEAA